MQNLTDRTQFIHWECITPYEYKLLGKELTIHYDTFHTPFGLCFIALTHRGICKLAFFDKQEYQSILLEELTNDWSDAHLVKDKIKTEPYIRDIFYERKVSKKPLKLLLKGSSFQFTVWEALLHIPAGQLITYQEVAARIGMPNAVRALASAVGKNHIAYLIPCHRVIRKNGDYGQYRWGKHRKAMLIAGEVDARCAAGKDSEMLS